MFTFLDNFVDVDDGTCRGKLVKNTVSVPVSVISSRLRWVVRAIALSFTLSYVQCAHTCQKR